jgi:type III restriction enzyme
MRSAHRYPRRHWELDEAGQPTQKIIENQRSAKFITPIPKPKKHKAAPAQTGFVFDEGKGLSWGLFHLGDSRRRSCATCMSAANIGM